MTIPSDEKRSTATASEYRIYVACLASYNAGILHGRWIDATLGEDHIESEVADMLAESPDEYPEEWAIHDYELGGWKIGEYESFGDVAEGVEALEHADEPGALIAYAESIGSTLLEAAGGDFEEAYCGEWPSFREYSDDYVESSGLLSGADEMALRYFDYEQFANDLEMDHFTERSPNGVWVFRYV